jgi:hypothetical protein
MPPAWLRIAGGNPNLLIPEGGGGVWHGAGPSTSLRLVPLPLRGRIC